MTMPSYEEAIRADYHYWILRTEVEMPLPSDKTLQMLGRAAYLLDKLDRQDTEVVL